MKKLLSQQHLLTGFNTNQPPEATLLYCQKLRNKMKDLGMFLSEIDLENDIASQMPTILAKYYGERVIDDSLINEMQKRKATFMFDFLRNSIDGIENLESMPLIEPLIKCKEIAEGTYAN
jgi:putative ATP-dependent endonuclease of OLD family